MQRPRLKQLQLLSLTTLLYDLEAQVEVDHLAVLVQALGLLLLPGLFCEGWILQLPALTPLQSVASRTRGTPLRAHLMSALWLSRAFTTKVLPTLRLRYVKKAEWQPPTSLVRPSDLHSCSQTPSTLTPWFFMPAVMAQPAPLHPLLPRRLHDGSQRGGKCTHSE